MSQSPDPGGPIITDRFEIIDEIGKGGYGTVYKAREKSTQILYALKKIKTFDYRQAMPSSFFRETDCLNALKGCDNILTYKDTFRCHENNCLFLVLELCDYDIGQIIRDHFSGESKIKFRHPYDEMIPNFMHQILIGISQIHSKGFIHRDIKPSNILYSYDNEFTSEDSFGTLKIGDFGLSRNLKNFNRSTRPLSPVVATPYYRAPELLLGSNNYDQSIDIWSLGCLFYEMVTGSSLFRPDSRLNSDFAQLLTVFKICGTPDAEIWPNMPNSELVLTLPKFPPTLEQILDSSINPKFNLLKDLLLQMLQVNPKDRISIQEALSHPFFTTPITSSVLIDSPPFLYQSSFILSSANSTTSPTQNEFGVSIQSHQFSTRSIYNKQSKKKMRADATNLRPERIMPPAIGVF